MSFNLSVRAEDGEVSVSASGEVPDGIFTVFGHSDDAQTSLGVNRQGLDGRMISSASHTHHKEQ